VVKVRITFTITFLISYIKNGGTDGAKACPAGGGKDKRQKTKDKRQMAKGKRIQFFNLF